MYAQQSDQDKELAQRIFKRQEKLESDRRTSEAHWQECMEYIVPRKGDITSTQNPGSKRGAELFDTTAIMANQLLAGALHGMLTNPSTRFFELVFSDPAIQDSDEVREWLQDVGERMFAVLNNSNFQTEVHEVYIDLGAIGTACLYMGEHDKNLIHFAARSMKEIYVEENNLGLIDIVHRRFQWSPRQIIQEFGEKDMHPYVLDEYKKGCEENWTIIHSVEPRENEKDGIYPFKSAYALQAKQEKIILSKKGYREFPYAVPRWTKTSGEKYGRGPGMEMLPDIKMVNKMMETTLKGAQTTVSPPLMVPDDGVVGKVRLTPSGLTVVRQGFEIKPLITDARIDFGYQAVEDVRKRIRSGFYVDQLQLNEGPQMTATEVMQRTEEKLRLMGPVLGRQHFEFLKPVIERVFGIMVRAGKIPEAPSKIKGKPFEVRYSSLVARAQRMSEGQNLTRAISVAAPLLQATPEALDNLDSDAALKYILEIYGVPQKIMRTQREIQGMRDARNQAREEAVQAQKEAHQADVASKVLPGMAQMEQAKQQ